MTKQNYYLRHLLWMACLLFATQKAWADDFMQNTFNYSCMQMGIDKIQFKLPTQYDGAFNEGISDGCVYLRIDGGERQTLFKWRCSNYRELDEHKIIEVFQPGVFNLTGQTYNQSKTNFTQSDGKVTYYINSDTNNKDHYTTTVEWQLPREYRGHHMKIEMWCHIEDRDRNWYIPVDVKQPTSFHELANIDTPEPGQASVTLNEPMMSVDRAHVNEIMLSYSFVVSNIFSATLHYTDAVTGQKYAKALSTKNKVDFAYIPANRPWNDIYISATVTDAQTKNTSEQNRINIESDRQTSHILHYPKGLGVTLNSSGHALLSWQVDDPKEPDLLEGDFFEVQRNLTGSTNANDANWKTINMEEQFQVGQGTYTFTDKNLIDQYEGKPVAYRVRRSGTSMWQWLDGSGYTQYQMPWILTLPLVQNATVQRTDVWNDESHQVQLNFDLLGYNYDNNGNFLVRNAEDQAQMQKLIGEGKLTKDKVIFTVSSLNDWTRCQKLVNDRWGDLHIQLANSIMLTDMSQMIGTGSKPFSGILEGEGNTLTATFNTKDSYPAPFRAVKNATFKNLRVSGSISTTNKFAGGLIGQLVNDGSVVLEQVSIDSELNLAIDGDASSGGIVGVMEPNSSIRMTDCSYKGRITGSKSNNNGGFIGVALAGTTITLQNCLFAPTQISTLKDGCKTFARTDQSTKMTMTNCYFTMDYGSTTINGKEYMTIESESDWTNFCKKVTATKGTPEVNAVLLADITVTQAAGSEGTPFTGHFEGNGHTMNVKLSNSTTQFLSPFVSIKNASITNLYVTGTVSGGIHASGLVGRAYGYNIISKVHVATEVTTSSTHAAGFIGHGGTSTNTIANCLFEGNIRSISAWTIANNYAGAFIAWENGGNNNKVTNCLENGIYIGFGHAGMNYEYNNGAVRCYGNAGSNANNYTYHDWGEALHASNLTMQELAKKLGSAWSVSGSGSPQIVMSSQAISYGNGGTQVDSHMSMDNLAQILGSKWQSANNDVDPVSAGITPDTYNYALWDSRAQLQLRINMHGAKGVEQRIVDISGNKDAMNARQFIQELTRKCVDYTFDIIVRRGASPLGIYGTELDSTTVAVTKIDQGEKTNYRFQNENHITGLKVKKKQSSVELTWKNTGGDFDFLRVLRRNHSNDPAAEWTDTIANNLNQLFFEDKTVLIQQAYDYRVESVWDCEGLQVAYADTLGVECESTGMIDGYIRMADGTALGGVEVYCSPVGTISGAQSVYIEHTDEAGYFAFRKLPYQGTGTYTVTVVTTGSSGSYTAPNDGGVVNFTQNSNWTQNFNFFMDTYFVYSGNVYYRDTSIPVPGVSFKLDGRVMHDASQQPIVTNNQGAFTLSIPSGPHTVQAVKDGHFFAFDGYLKNEDAREGESDKLYNFNKNVSSAIVWDSTTVVLRGRVAGGDIQGSKPWGKGLSVNNLGDSLKIVMQLEGDNASYLIRKQDDETVKSASYDLHFGPDNKQASNIHVTRHTLTIRPDAKTGEYMVELHPAKYKVIEISAQGYATLFQSGKVGETVDLTDSIRGSVAEYNRIYHSVPTVEVTQFNASGEKFFGVKSFTAQDNIGNKSDVNIWYLDKDSVGHYSFGHPVFMAGSPYGFMMQACEKYYWNNDLAKRVDIVNLDSKGRISIKNALTTDSKKAEWSSDLDSLGGCSYIFTPDNTTFVLENDNALKAMDITLLYDGSYYDVKPFNGQILRGYVMATQPKREGRKAVVAGTPKLWDILRDPPGGGSSSYIKEGSKLSYGYSLDVAATTGFSVETSTGSGANTYHGFVAAPSGSGETTGDISSAKTEKGVDLKFEANYGHSWSFNYNMDISERVQTRSSSKWIGGKADIFIGTTENVIIQDAMAVRVLPDSMYQLVKRHEGGSFKTANGVTVKVPVGTTKKLAQGIDDTGKPIYLVRDEVMSMSPQVTSTFFHSQEFIENELLPDLIKMRNSLLLPKGTDPAKAQALANRRGYATYVSQVADNDDYYGLNYDIYRPSFETTGDSIAALNNELVTWAGYLAKNEQEKLSVLPANLVKRYDFDGGASSIQYSETFSVSNSMTQYIRYPIMNGLGNILSGTGPLAFVMKAVEKALEKKGGSIGTAPEYSEPDENSDPTEVDMQVWGSTWKTQWKIILYANVNDKFNTSESHSKEIGFTLATASKSSLTVDVYHTVTEATMDKNANVFYKLTEDMLGKVREGYLGTGQATFTPLSGAQVFSNFVFRTVGGATCQPYEDERVTKWYQPGTVLDVATIPIDKPRIWIDEPVVSNVPFDEPARFTLHMANETDYPNQSSLIFNYFILGSSNPNGARICVDGKPLSSSGESITLYPAIDQSTGKHAVFTKEITVYPSKAFDYEDLTICLVDPEDVARVYSQKFSAHFIPTGGKVRISVPSDKWVINTESPYDGRRQAWYMPVRIEGFDINWPNFDHIELQYKLSTQGDKDWVNVCSYYADRSLLAKASGVTDTIPDNGIITAPFYGENDPIEQYYDIRAVTYCRHAGGYLTGSSEVLTGIKDTRLPIAFGTPEPTTGILGIGDDIKIRFSEPIAGNYLRNINNFEVLGTLNSNAISTSTSLSFDNEAMAVTQGTRNLSGKQFTVDLMINPATDKRDMTVFLHGGEEKGLHYGITADRRLMAVVNGQTVTSDSIVLFNNELHEVAYALSQTDDGMTLTFFDGSKEIGSKKISGAYEAASPLVLGYDPYNEENCFKGEMLEFRLWNRAMTYNLLERYGKKRLTGYESGLLDYYPMNEGEGEWCYDKASGSMDLITLGTNWKRPTGISLAMKGDKGLRMDPEKFVRTADHDYTLMFWFQTADSNATLFANGEALRGQENQINIGVDSYGLYVRSAGFERKDIALAGDGGWHHFAMTVSRSQNVANVYLDKRLCESFAADSLSGISSDHIALGATYRDKNTIQNPMTGHIDEVGMFSSVLPVNLIREYSNHTPVGTMSALMAYLDFGRSQKMDNNMQHLEPTGISLKRYVDNQGKVLARRDTLVAQADVEAFAARDTYAPMVSNAQLDNLNYSFASNNNELLIDITEPDYMVEKTNVYVTVKDIPDLQGNLMASPVTLNLYVYRTPLRWDVKRIEEELIYGGEKTYTATIRNLSGVAQNFSLDDLPVWITASQTQGTIDALDERKITFTVSDYINIGTYNEQVTLTCDNGMTETLPMTLRVHGDEPDWYVSEQLKIQNQTMMMVARVKIDGVVASSAEDILAVFDENQQVLGKAYIAVNDKAAANEALAYLTVYGYTKNGKSPNLYFRFFKASTGSVYSVSPTDNSIVTFEKDAIVGSASQPVILENRFDFVQTMKLKKGWNWVSFNVRPKCYFNEEGELIGTVTVGEFLNSMSKWEAGDRITSINGTKVQQYTCREDQTSACGYRWSDEDKEVDIDNRQMYNIYSMSDKTVYLEGTFLYDEITVHKDWNRIGYLSNINLPIAQALSDYSDEASEGDVVKSQDGFAIATQISSGGNTSIVWKGSLQYLEAGKGYMLKRKADNEVTFAYPLYYSDNRYSSTDGTVVASRRSSVNTLATMNIVAAVEGIETEAGDRLVVFCGAERMAEATADSDRNFYLNIGSDTNGNEPLTFTVERDGETVAMTASRICYAPNQVMGTPSEPTAISFTALAGMPHDGKWYTVSGIQVGKKPVKSGLYIHNGQAVIIK